jgi:predicted hydrocarbon binding protein
MAKIPPQLPIEVDTQTGVWTTDNLPMIYMPRHFFINNHKAVEAALGMEAYAPILYDAGYKSAWQWCERESATHGLRGLDVFRHYMRRISQRGWAQFTIEELDAATGACAVRVDHSVFVYEYGRQAHARVCYMFAGWFPGALEWAARDLNREWKLTSHEAQCACEGHDHCLFVIQPR